MRYLLDTNIVSDLVRHPLGKVAQHIRKVGEAESAPASSSPRNCVTGHQKRVATASAQLEAVLSALEVLPFETPADAAYGKAAYAVGASWQANWRQ